MKLSEALCRISGLWGTWDEDTKALVCDLVAGIRNPETKTCVHFEIEPMPLFAAKIVESMKKAGYKPSSYSGL